VPATASAAGSAASGSLARAEHGFFRPERDLLDLFNEQKTDVKKYLRKNDLRFKKDPGNTIVKAAEYYDQLKK